MKINLFFIGFLSILMAFVSTSFAAYNDAGTAYSNQTTDTWIQDRAGEGIKMVNSLYVLLKTQTGERGLIHQGIDR